MLAATVDSEPGELESVVYDTCEPVAPEKAIEGMPSMAASQAAPLFDFSKNVQRNSSFAYTVPEPVTTEPRLSEDSSIRRDQTDMGNDTHYQCSSR